MYYLLLSKLKLLLRNPIILFVYGIFAKWYVIVMIPAIMVVYWVFTGLTTIGFLQEAERVVTTALKDTKYIARYCVPKIVHWGDFWECLQNPEDYEETAFEQDLREGLEDLIDLNNYNDNQDPYAEDPYEDTTRPSAPANTYPTSSPPPYSGSTESTPPADGVKKDTTRPSAPANTYPTSSPPP